MRCVWITLRGKCREHSEMKKESTSSDHMPDKECNKNGLPLLCYPK